MSTNLKYKRVLLKVSGEALLGEQEFGIDQKPVEMIAKEIKEAAADKIITTEDEAEAMWAAHDCSAHN